MAKYPPTVARIESLIHELGLKVGDALPSERDLARRLGVAYGTIRSANDYLIRQGIIDRHQGKGTFIAKLPRQAPSSAPGTPTRRLGLLLVDYEGTESPFLRDATFDSQRLAQQAGYELIIDKLSIDDIMAGNMPSIIQRRSVDGLLIYGKVRDYHIDYLSTQSLPYILVGNRSLNTPVPRVELNAHDLTYQLTRELIRAGRREIWLDVDTTKRWYTTGFEMLGGYQQALAEFISPSEPLRLCPLRMHTLDAATQQLASADLSQAVLISNSWLMSIFQSMLMMRGVNITPLWMMPMSSQPQVIVPKGPSFATWEDESAIPNLAALAVPRLLDFIEGRSPDITSARIEFECRWKPPVPIPVPDGSAKTGKVQGPGVILRRYHIQAISSQVNSLGNGVQTPFHALFSPSLP